MSHWNYRVFRHEYTHGGEQYYEIHECYYDDDGNVNGWTENAICPYGDTPEELESVLKMMGEAFSKPILDYEEKNDE